MEKGFPVKIKRSSNCCVKTFKCLLILNFTILLCYFLVYALCSLYQLKSAFMNPEEYFDVKNNEATTSEVVSVNVGDSLDFREWQNSIRQQIQNHNNSSTRKLDKTSSLNLLLDTITNVMKNFANISLESTIMSRNEISVANLTDFELRLLQEYAKMSKTSRSKGN